MSKQSKRIKAVIAGTLAVIFASSVFSGTRARAEVPVAEVDLDLPRQVRMVDAASVISVKGAAEALEEKPDTVCIPELYSVGAAKALLTDDTGAKEAAKTAVGAIIEAEIAVEDVREAQIVSENEAEARDPEHFSNLVIADVDNFVNVRAVPSTDGDVVGKLYDNSAGQFIEERNGWYKIKSGNVTGYVKAEYCVTGENAIELAKKVGTRMATVNTTTLRVRMEKSMDSGVLGLIPMGEDLVVLEETPDWVKVSIEEGDGYVSTEYVDLRTDFVQAESKAEEEARLAKEEAERKAAIAAAEAAAKKNSKKNSSSNSSAAYTAPSIPGSGLGVDVANYACQFVGNPYVYGGTSLTNGADCSGFVMSVYRQFGVSLPHSSTADRSVGYEVPGGIANAQPGDILCYSGHVALYIGGGKIVHASTSRTGIVIGNANYRGVLAVRRIF